MCLICGWIYYEDLVSPEEGLAPGTRWAPSLPAGDARKCGAAKKDFVMVERCSSDGASCRVDLPSQTRFPIQVPVDKDPLHPQ